MKKNSLVFMSAFVLASLLFSACGGATQPPAAQAPAATEAPAATQAPVTADGELYYLNFKPEVAETYAKIADAWNAETGTYPQSGHSCIRDVRADAEIGNRQVRSAGPVPD